MTVGISYYHASIYSMHSACSKYMKYMKYTHFITLQRLTSFTFQTPSHHFSSHPSYTYVYILGFAGLNNKSTTEYFRCPSVQVDAMEELAQGRVWTGKAAVERRLVDAIGGFHTALAIAKEKAGIAAEQPVRGG